MNCSEESGLYLFIIWEKSRFKEKDIMNDIKKKFIIRQVYEVFWSKEHGINNLKRFYGSIFTAKRKAEKTGAGPFLLILVNDLKPIFRQEKTINENNLININVYNSKMTYRKWIDNEFAVHGSLSDKETNHDAYLLLGKNIKTLENDLPEYWDGLIKKLKSELIGYDGWTNLKQLFSTLNNTSAYVILRNFEDLPEKISYKDIDILTNDSNILYIIDPLRSTQSTLNTHSATIKTQNKSVIFHPQYFDNIFYDNKWSKDILKRRILHPNGFFIPCLEDYFFTLLFHTIYHKKQISERYKIRLLNLAKELKFKQITPEFLDDFNRTKKFLKNYMKNNGYRDTSSLKFQTIHNEIFRLFKVSFYMLRYKGIKYFSKALKNKFKLVFTKNN